MEFYVYIQNICVTFLATDALLLHGVIYSIASIHMNFKRMLVVPCPHLIFPSFLTDKPLTQHSQVSSLNLRILNRTLHPNPNHLSRHDIDEVVIKPDGVVL